MAATDRRVREIVEWVRDTRVQSWSSS